MIPFLARGVGAGHIASISFVFLYIYPVLYMGYSDRKSIGKGQNGM
jgi:hypothetical protein